MKTKISLLLMLILLIPASLVLAKGRRPDKVIITGPDLTSPIEVTSPQITGALMAMHIPILEKVENPYTISFFQRDEHGELGRTPFHAYSYFPDTICERGLVFDPYLENSSRWFFATPEGEAAIERLIQTKVTSETPSRQATTMNWRIWAPWMVSIGITFVNGIVTFGLLRRKQKYVLLQYGQEPSTVNPGGEESTLNRVRCLEQK
jgi:hypothetical protein